MADSTQLPFTSADDAFETHYAEKIWALVPEVYRNADGLAEYPGRLRAFVEILAGEAAIARRSVDRLWADTRADEADDWAIPYIGTLIGSRPVSSLNRAAQRANLARTILYRRRQGTVRLTELLADDIADWDAIASEGFKRVIRHWYLLDSGPEPGRISSSPQWGYADLRNVRISDILDGAHDDLAHFPDFRRHRGHSGRYGIPKVNLHLFRHYAYQLTSVTPRLIAAGHYTLDPSGRDVALYQPGRDTADACAAPREWEMRAPIPCHRLHTADFRPQITHAPAGLETLLMPLYGRRFATEAGMLEAATAALAADPVPPNTLADSQAQALIAAAMEDETSRRNLLPGGDGDSCAIALTVAPNATDTPLGPEQLYSANLAEWGVDHAPPGWVEAMIDPQLGRVVLTNPLAARRELFIQKIHYGAFWPVGAGSYDRASELSEDGFTLLDGNNPDFTTLPISGEFRFADSRSFTPILPADGIITVDGDLTLTAPNGERPFIEMTLADGNLTLRAVEPGLTLTLDGLWLSIIGAATATLTIDGSWSRVVLRNITLDPGGERAHVPPAAPQAIPSVTLNFGGAIDDIVIANCITGPITETVTEVDPCAVDTIIICDSIVDSSVAGEPALFLRNACAQVDRCTIFGALITGALDASDTIVDGQVRVEDAQAGCFRFSAAAKGGRVPQPYQSHFYAAGMPSATFISKRFSDASFAQLSEVAPEEIRSGGEGGTEMGAFNAALDPIKRADLRDKLEEFMPINAIAQMVFEN